MTIYQDAKPDGSNARILVYRCDIAEGDEWTGSDCAMPDGGPMLGQSHRVEAHVPPNTVVQEFGEGTADPGSDEDREERAVAPLGFAQISSR